MAVDQEPVTALQNQETASTNTLQAYNEVNTLLNTLQTAVSAMDLTSSVDTTQATVSSSAPFTATSTNAQSGSYNIAVTQLAQAQLNLSGGYTDTTDSELGDGTVTINNQVIDVDSVKQFLAGINRRNQR